jgi:hypothetical protein
LVEIKNEDEDKRHKLAGPSSTRKKYRRDGAYAQETSPGTNQPDLTPDQTWLRSKTKTKEQTEKDQHGQTWQLHHCTRLRNQLTSGTTPTKGIATKVARESPHTKTKTSILHTTNSTLPKQ